MRHRSRYQLHASLSSQVRRPSQPRTACRSCVSSDTGTASVRIHQPKNTSKSRVGFAGHRLLIRCSSDSLMTPAGRMARCLACASSRSASARWCACQRGSRSSHVLPLGGISFVVDSCMFPRSGRPTGAQAGNMPVTGTPARRPVAAGDQSGRFHDVLKLSTGQLSGQSEFGAREGSGLHARGSQRISARPTRLPPPEAPSRPDPMYLLVRAGARGGHSARVAQRCAPKGAAIGPGSIPPHPRLPGTRDDVVPKWITSEGNSSPACGFLSAMFGHRLTAQWFSGTAERRPLQALVRHRAPDLFAELRCQLAAQVELGCCRRQGGRREAERTPA